MSRYSLILGQTDATFRGVNIEYGWGGGGGVLYENKTDQLLNLDRLQLKTVNNVGNWFSRNSYMSPIRQFCK